MAGLQLLSSHLSARWFKDGGLQDVIFIGELNVSISAS